ncbi:MAG: hypothetical protein ACKOOC_07550, partial [Cyanobium sp.]
MLLRLRLVLGSVAGAMLVGLAVCLGAQNLSDRPTLQLGFGRTAPLPSGFLLGVALAAGLLSGGSAAAVLPIAVDDQREIQAAPWSPAVLPPSADLRVDKTVELQARPLAEMPELGLLPTDEQDRQALVLVTTPRQAKRHCGRTQRGI